ncbi:RNA polymerase sigma factor [Planctomycetes bacterium Poly30]|uniref:RNA polymerase sigma factor n=2 Tax=Saltatorellus ferox TaxID=2528018 RepID=A0A518EVF1_9BACT|nr:RNA polymerase sigma factor [Planctomycetes bacterium Poly30]
MQAILEQDDWLRRMARRLFHDPSFAEDAVQDAWMAELARKAPVADSSSWLGGVLRNLRREKLRADARQSAHASEVRSRGVALAPATDEVVADLQLRQGATEALLALDEPIRTTLYLRFVQDLTVTEVARQMNVAQSTASDRIVRGLESLRTTLDAQHGGDRRAWLAVLAPLAFESKKPAATGLSTAAIVGWVAAVCVASSVGTAVLLRSAGTELASQSSGPAIAASSPSLNPGVPSTVGSATDTSTGALEPLPPPPARPKATREQPRLAAAATAAGDPEPVASAQDEEPKAPPKCRVRAQVLLPDGTPAIGASWRLIAAVGKNPPGGWEHQSGVVDGEGKVDVSFTPPPNTFLALTFSLEGYVRVGKEWNGMEQGTEETLEPIRFYRSGQLRGRLVDGAGNPILGKRYALQLMAPGRVRGIPVSFGPGFKIDPKDGSFELKNLVPGKSQLNYRVKDVGWVAGPLVEVVPGETREIDIVWSDAEVEAAKKRSAEEFDFSNLPQLEPPPRPKPKAEPKEKLEPVRLTLDLGDAVEREDSVQAAFMGRMDLNGQILLGKGGRLGPASVDPGAAHTLWIRGQGWLALVNQPALQAGGEQTLHVDLDLIERRVLVLKDGEPVRDRAFIMQVLPSQFHQRPGAGFWKTDAEGRVTLKLGRLPEGERYRFTLEHMKKGDPPMMFGEAPWDGSAADLTVNMK